MEYSGIGSTGRLGVQISEEIMESILQHMRKSYPAEGCGILFGKPLDGGNSWSINKFLPCRNLSPSPGKEFLLDPKVWIPGSLSPDLTGIVHSHPVSGPEPSLKDLKQLQQFGAMIKLYLIVSTSPTVSRNAAFSGHKNPPHFSFYGVESGESGEYTLLKLSIQSQADVFKSD
ncbi:Mov34/MPN/PAD-1 family protein [Paenibacillus pinistramenti]|uniref:Mov34/MPN/PAD-1 family protein n=1 Tax=Paenibacillus pinistramenti TaxID=1768003 RepID=UPI0011084829|nr:M67 family metallopeptidase [Paenibacillus pinistramenti]